MQSMTRWCLNEGLYVIWRINLRLFPIGRVNLQGLSGITTPNVKNRTLASDLRQMGANWREARLRGSIVPRPPLPMLSERIGGDNRPNFLTA